MIKMVGRKIVLKDNIKTRALKNGKVYTIISVERGWFRVMTEFDDDYLFPPKIFDLVEEMDDSSEMAHRPIT